MQAIACLHLADGAVQLAEALMLSCQSLMGKVDSTYRLQSQ